MTATAAPASTARPLRSVAFDAKDHARLFRVDTLALSASARGNPRLLLEIEHEGAQIRAGTITYIPPAAPTLGGTGHPASLAVHGRMAEFSDEQIALITAAGMRVVSEEGRKKTFRTIFIDIAQVEAAKQVLSGLRTSNDKPCFKGSFTANAITECLRLLREQGTLA